MLRASDVPQRESVRAQLERAFEKSLHLRNRLEECTSAIEGGGRVQDLVAPRPPVETMSLFELVCGLEAQLDSAHETVASLMNDLVRSEVMTATAALARR